MHKAQYKLMETTMMDTFTSCRFFQTLEPYTALEPSQLRCAKLAGFARSGIQSWTFFQEAL